MNYRLRLAFRGFRQKPFFTILLLAVTTIAMVSIISAYTNAVSIAYQKKVFENHLGHSMESILHIQYMDNSEDTEFAQVLTDYLEYIQSLDGVAAVGRYHDSGNYFVELKDNTSYIARNQELLRNTRYADFPGISRVLLIDEGLLPMVKTEIRSYPQTTSGAVPLYASESYKNILPVGTLLTSERAGTQGGTVYEVIGYFSDKNMWLSKDDLIRYPMISAQGYFIAPFSTENNADILTQLSCLHNTYVIVSDTEQIPDIKDKISNYSVSHGFKATAITLQEEYADYERETDSLTARQTFLAAFIGLMAATSIIAVFTTNSLLKKKQYGIFLANGFTLIDITLCITLEIFFVTLVSALTAWLIKFLEFWNSADLFREVMLEAHSTYTVLFTILTAIIITGIATVIPTYKILKYRPCELIGGMSHDNSRT